MNFSRLFYKTSLKQYFNYPCPRKLREVVKMTMFEREQPQKIKQIWKQYYDQKPNAMGLHIDGDEFEIIKKKYSKI
jgi:ATP synthase F1 complex assembly factor 1